jgi:hypothetical protein
MNPENKMENWEVEFEETSPLAFGGRAWAKEFTRQTLLATLTEVEEEVKGIQGNPFEDSEEYLDGTSFGKAKSLEIIRRLKAELTKPHD